MRFFLFVCLSLAFVQTVFVWNESYAQTRAQPRAPTDQIDEMLGNREAPRKPQTIAEYTRLHYEQCMQTEHPYLAGADLRNMCICSTDLFPKNMTLEQIQAMEDGGVEGAFQRDRMMLFIYTPCIKPVVKKMMLSQCMSNKKSEFLMKNQSVTCSCIADRLSDKMAELAPGYIQTASRYPREGKGPFDIVMHPDTFEKQMSHKTRVCVELYED